VSCRNVRHKVAKDRLLRARTVAPAATSEHCKAKQDEQGGNIKVAAASEKNRSESPGATKPRNEHCFAASEIMGEVCACVDDD